MAQGASERPVDAGERGRPPSGDEAAPVVRGIAPAAHQETMATGILITGATGSIGANAVRYFRDRGYAVRAQVRPHSRQLHKIEDLEVEICEVDLRDGEGLAALTKDVDCIAHFGAQVPKGNPAARDYLDLNAGATLALLEGVRRHNRGLQRFVFASTCALYEFVGWRSSPITDAQRFAHPTGMYRVTKRAAELMVHSYHREHGVPTVVLALPETLCGRELLGERRQELTPYTEDRLEVVNAMPPSAARDCALRHLQEALAAGKRLVLPLGPSGVPWRQHLGDVRDVVRACELACRAPRAVGESLVVMSAALDYGKGIPHLSRVSGLPYAEVFVPGADNYWFDMSRTEELLGYLPEHDSESMLEDAWRHQSGEDLGIVDGTDYPRRQTTP